MGKEKSNGEKRSKVIVISVITITILIGVLIIWRNNVRLSLLSNVNNVKADVTAIKNYKCVNGGTLNENTGLCTITTDSVKKCDGVDTIKGCYSTFKLNSGEVDYACDGDVQPNADHKCIYKRTIITSCPTGYKQKDQYTCYRLISGVKTTSLKCPDDYSQIGSSNLCQKTYKGTQTTVPYCSKGGTPVKGMCQYKYSATKSKQLVCPSGYNQVGSSSTCQYSYRVVLTDRKHPCPKGGSRSGNYCYINKNGTWKNVYTCPQGGTRNSKNECVVDYKAQQQTKLICPQGGDLSGSNCIIKVQGEWKDSYSCPQGEKSGNNCLISVNIDRNCPDGYSRTEDSNVCKKETPAKIINYKSETCPSGYTKFDGNDKILIKSITKGDCYKKIDYEYSCSNSSYKLTPNKLYCTYTYNASVTSMSCSKDGYHYDTNTKKCVKNSNTPSDNVDNNTSPKEPSNSNNNTTTIIGPSIDYTTNSSPLEVSPSSVDIIYANQRPQLNVKGLAKSENVTFESKNKNVAIVDSNGIITPVSVGKTNITIKRNNKTNVNDECIVVVKVSAMQISATAINASIEKNILKIGETTKINATVVPENATIKKLKYSSSNVKVATVNSDGIITAKGKGETTIYAASLDNSKIARGIRILVEEDTNNENIDVSNIPDSVVISDDTIVEKFIATDVTKVYMDVNDTKQLNSKYYILKQDGTKTQTTENNEDLAYISEDENIVSVSEKGLITAKNIGKTNIKVYSKTEPNIYKKVKIIVEKTNLTLENEIKVEESIIDMVKGDTKSIKVMEYDVSQLKFKSKKSSIAKVSSKGIITAVNEGTTEIIIKNKIDNTKTKSITVNVYKEDSFDKFESNNEIVTISLNYNRIDIVKGNTLKIKASSSDNSKLLWESSNTKIVQVNKSGRIKAIKKGKAIITVYSKDNKKISEKITVNVVKKEKDLVKLDEVNTKKLGLVTQNTTLQVQDTKQIELKKDIEGVIYRSENEKIAKVNDSGLITAIAPGKTKIMVTTINSSDYVSVKVIKKVVPKTIEINESEITLSLQEEYTLNPTISPRKAKNKNLLYASTNSDIAEVTDDGKIIAKGVGSAYVAIISEEINSVKTYIHVIVK